MITYVYAEHHPAAGQVVIPQPYGREKQSDDFEHWTLSAARAYRATVPRTAATDYSHRSAQNVIDYRR